MGAPRPPGRPLFARASWDEAGRDGALLDIFGRTRNVLAASCPHAIGWVSGRFKAGRQLN